MVAGPMAAEDLAAGLMAAERIAVDSQAAREPTAAGDTEGADSRRGAMRAIVDLAIADMSRAAEAVWAMPSAAREAPLAGAAPSPMAGGIPLGAAGARRILSERRDLEAQR